MWGLAITRRNAFIVDLLKILLGLKMLLGGLKFPKTLRCYGSGLWKANQKYNGIDQNILQYCYGHDKLYLQMGKS